MKKLIEAFKNTKVVVGLVIFFVAVGLGVPAFFATRYVSKADQVRTTESNTKVHTSILVGLEKNSLYDELRDARQRLRDAKAELNFARQQARKYPNDQSFRNMVRKAQEDVDDAKAEVNSLQNEIRNLKLGQ